MVSEEIKSKFKNMYENDISIIKIAKMLGVSRNLVRTHLIKCGVIKVWLLCFRKRLCSSNINKQKCW